MAQLEIQQELQSRLPSGFNTTLYESDRIRRLEDSDVNRITEVVEDFGQNRLNEQAVIRREVERVRTAFVTPESTLELPGTSMELNNGHLFNFAAKYKTDNDTPSGTIKPPELAGTDDVVFTFASPEVYEEVSGTPVDNFLQPNLTGGNTLDVIADNGIDEATNSNAANMTLDDDEWMYFTGDFVDLESGRSVITKIQWNDIDAEDFGPSDALLSTRLSGAHIITSQGAWVQSTVDLDAKIYDDGDAELVPIAFYMGPGTKAPALV